MDAIQVSDLTKRFGSFTAVDHISFSVAEGEIFGFLGPNGSGKSTTIRMLTGTVRPDEGTAAIMGYDICKHPIRARTSIGFVPEMANAYVELTAWRNLMFMGELYGIPRRERERRASELLKRFGLYDRRGDQVRAFSKGMRQRLLLCMALINDPPVLILDEPASGLDVESSRLIKEVIRELNREGTTVFLTTHDIEDASQLCDKVAIINRGVIIAVDRPEALRLAGSAHHCIEVSFSRSVDERRISGIHSVREVMKSGDKLRLYVDDIDTAIASIVEYAKTNNMRILALSTLAPSLEDIFVRLTHKTGAE
ncbi:MULTISPECIES: daunorubicin resistance protein DrrA family ABC transporter ATP-binding protein [Methanothrix]|uniref:Daunorubicin resistance ABC transporter ATPase subunit n=1 Tax=Methanothrix thermoacetophila (strain DSM 6194 / JCM 14653 / NBRC 101360 / PT) TaxID=349307 RepID=A0B8I3_METTP|nr:MULTISPECIES: daunorubicin resistance protein DrrA family ABC transporter ATP-binding protein [Methanothrix]ABK15007.1 daunorubicin resistance ABC transporter ATPase subunit [Methanothrix thermoacetophila PT]NPU86878.1 daunorubicin resistance protein DrrA family ABC transporter ATP-binding protein [Methanothrix sp.]